MLYNGIGKWEKWIGVVDERWGGEMTWERDFKFKLISSLVEQIPETLPDRVLEKMKAPPKDADVAVIRPEQLAEADGFIFGSPSRFGMMAAQFLAFFEATHELWVSQKLAGKPAGIFWSTGFHGGGQENTA